MATVIQVHRFLANLSLGQPDKQQELADAVDELKKRQQRLGSNGKLYVSKDDMLYKLYIEGLKQKPHQFERYFGTTRCVIHANTPLERADLVILFLHGLGASPWHFLRVATLLYDQNHTKANIAFIFPFGPAKMRPGEFGAVEDSLYGSYKWWSIFNDKTSDADVASPTMEAGLLTGASLAVPSILREAMTSPRIFPPVSTVSSSANTPSPSKQNKDVIWEPPRTMHKTMTYPGSKTNPWFPNGDELTRDHFPITMTPKRIHLKWYQQCGLCLNPTEALSDDSEETMDKDSFATTKFTVDNPEGREKANEMIMELFAMLEEKYRIPLSRIGLCGFSQGAMLAVDVLHRLKKGQPAFLAIFSGAPMCVSDWKNSLQRSAAMRRTPILQYHGQKDWIFPIFIGRWLHRFLLREGLNMVEYQEFPGDHELTEQSKEVGNDQTIVAVQQFNEWVINYAIDKSAFNFSYARKRIGSSIASKIDDLFYK